MPYGFTSRIRYSEIDENGILTIPALVNYFQDVSTFQSEELGIGVDFMKSQHKAWLLSSWQIVIGRMPALCEEVTAETWPYEFKDFYGLRNFDLRDRDGKLLAWANSIWFEFDTETQRPVKVGEEEMKRYPIEPKMDMDYAPRKIRVPKGGEEAEHFVIGKQNLDTNHHVNNGQYIAMAAEYLPEEFVIGQIRAEYRMQAYLGDEVVPVVVATEDGVTVSLNNTEGKAFAIVEMTKRANADTEA